MIKYIIVTQNKSEFSILCTMYYSAERGKNKGGLAEVLVIDYQINTLSESNMSIFGIFPHSSVILCNVVGSVLVSIE